MTEESPHPTAGARPAGPEVASAADAIAAAALAVPGVVRLHAGSFGEVATYLPGRRVSGVRATETITEVHVVLAVDRPVIATAEAIRSAVGPLVTTPVDVYVDDLDQPAAPRSQSPAATPHPPTEPAEPTPQENP